MSDSGSIKNHNKLRPWGLWATLGFSLIIILAAVFAQIVVTVCFTVVSKILHLDIHLSSLGSNGLLLAIGTCITSPMIVGLAFLFAKLRRGTTVKEYFCFNKTGRKEYSRWVVALFLLSFCSDLLSIILHKPIVPDFVVQAYSTARFTPLLWFAIIILAPLSEEILFRGFLFKGIENSRIGPAGAVILSSVGWSALHIQYDLYGIATVFAGGILLGSARFKTNSIYVPILLHAIWSLKKIKGDGSIL